MFKEQYLNKLTLKQFAALEKTAVGRKRLLDVLEEALRKAHYDGLYSGREKYNVSARWYAASVSPKAEFGMTKREPDGFYSIPILYYSQADKDFHIGKYYSGKARFSAEDVFCWTYYFEPDLSEFLTQNDIIGDTYG